MCKAFRNLYILGNSVPNDNPVTNTRYVFIWYKHMKV